MQSKSSHLRLDPENCLRAFAQQLNFGVEGRARSIHAGGMTADQLSVEGKRQTSIPAAVAGNSGLNATHILA